MTNDIIETYESLGVEAARRVIFENMSSIFYSNAIDDFNSQFFHTLSDFMTHTGKLTKMDIHGLRSVKKIHTFQQATFETPERAFTEASVYGKKDPLTSASSNVVLGQIGPYGGGKCDLLVDNY